MTDCVETKTIVTGTFTETIYYTEIAMLCTSFKKNIQTKYMKPNKSCISHSREPDNKAYSGEEKLKVVVGNLIGLDEHVAIGKINNSIL